MRNLLLTLHIIGVAGWLGGNLTQMMLLPIFDRSGHAAARIWHEASGQMAKVYYSVAGVLITITGIALLLLSDSPWSFSDPFVSIGFAVVLIGGLMGVLFFAPASRAAVTAHDEHDPGAVAKVRRRFTLGSIIDTGLVVFTTYAMVARLGA